MRAGVVHGAVIIASLAAALSCGGGTEPSGPSGLSGTWVVTFSQQQAGSAACESPSMILSLSQTGAALAGSYSADGFGICLLGSSILVGDMAFGAITSGNADQGQVTVVLRPALQLSGTFEGDSMSGSLSWGVILPGQAPVEMTGTWNARRLPATSPVGVPYRMTFTSTANAVPQTSSVVFPVVARDRGGNLVNNPALTYTTSDAAVATVSNAGIVTAGTSLSLFRIRAQAGIARAEGVGVVIQRPTVVMVNPATLAFTARGSRTLTVSVTDAAGAPIPLPTLSFQSSDAAVAPVSPGGTVSTAGRSGTATITVTAGLASAQVPVTVSLVPDQLRLLRDTVALPNGTSTLLGTLVLDSTGGQILDAALTWTTTDPSIVTVSGTGLATAGQLSGLATITATVGNLRDSAVVLARPGPFPSMSTQEQLSGAPEDVVASAAGAVYVTASNGFGLLRGDLPSRTLPTFIPAVWDTTAYVAFNPMGTRAYAGSTLSGKILVVDVAASSVVDSLAEGTVRALATSADGATLYVGNTRGLFSYDAATLAPIDSLLLGPVRYILRHPVSPLLYASSDSLVEVSTPGLATVRSFARPAPVGTLLQLAITADGATLFASDLGVGLRSFDVGSGQQLRQGARGDRGVAYSAGRDLLFVTGTTASGGISVLDPGSLIELYHAITIGPGRRVAVSPDGTTGLITDRSGSLFFID